MQFGSHCTPRCPAHGPSRLRWALSSPPLECLGCSRQFPRSAPSKLGSKARDHTLPDPTSVASRVPLVHPAHKSVVDLAVCVFAERSTDHFATPAAVLWYGCNVRGRTDSASRMLRLPKLSRVWASLCLCLSRRCGNSWRTPAGASVSCLGAVVPLGVLVSALLTRAAELVEQVHPPCAFRRHLPLRHCLVALQQPDSGSVGSTHYFPHPVASTLLEHTSPHLSSRVRQNTCIRFLLLLLPSSLLPSSPTLNSEGLHRYIILKSQLSLIEHARRVRTRTRKSRARHQGSAKHDRFPLRQLSLQLQVAQPRQQVVPVRHADAQALRVSQPAHDRLLLPLLR